VCRAIFLHRFIALLCTAKVVNTGIKYMLLATFFFAIMNVTVKVLPGIPVYEIIFFRSLVTLVMSAIAIKQKGLSFLGNNKKLLILRGLFGSAGLLLYFITVKEMPLASAVVIQYLSPIFSTILAIYILHQPMKPIKWLFYVIAFVGVFVVKGFDSRISMTMFACGVGSAIFSGLAYNMIGKLKGQDDPLVVVMYFPLVTLPLIAIPTAMVWVTPSWVELCWLIGMGVSTQLAQLLMTRAFQAEDISKVAIFQYVGLIYALVFGYFIFDESFNLQSIAGMLLLVAGVVLSAIYGTIETKKLNKQV
jgi:drug/metabolite transporter (DMT)-like permease